MNEFVQRHPEVTADLLFVDRVVNLVEEGLDAAVRIGHLGDSSLVAIPLGEVRRIVCASPAYLRSRGIPRRPEDLRAHSCVRFTGLRKKRAEWTFRGNPRKVAILQRPDLQSGRRRHRGLRERPWPRLVPLVHGRASHAGGRG